MTNKIKVKYIPSVHKIYFIKLCKVAFMNGYYK